MQISLNGSMVRSRGMILTHIHRKRYTHAPVQYVDLSVAWQHANPQNCPSGVPGLALAALRSNQLPHTLVWLPGHTSSSYRLCVAAAAAGADFEEEAGACGRMIWPSRVYCTSPSPWPAAVTSERVSERRRRKNDTKHGLARGDTRAAVCVVSHPRRLKLLLLLRT